MRKYYWFKSGGWTLAIDATSRRDAGNYLKIHHLGREFEYLGQFPAPTWDEHSMACGAITERRQAEISAEIRKEE